MADVAVGSWWRDESRVHGIAYWIHLIEEKDTTNVGKYYHCSCFCFDYKTSAFIKKHKDTLDASLLTRIGKPATEKEILACLAIL